jgi:hypothetical protein
MKEIQLTLGKVAIIDDEDFEMVSKYKWFAQKKRNSFYVKRSDWRKGKVIGIYLHRYILNAPKGIVVDHINGDPLDNRRCNLRFCTTRLNCAARTTRRLNKVFTSRYRGVSQCPKSSTWRARIKVNFIEIHLGCFKTQEEAAGAYNNAALIHNGQFADLNKI